MTAEDRELLDEMLAALAEPIEQVSLPLHILLDHHFGELNDNQMEMIEAARAQAAQADRLLRQVRRIRELAREPVDRAAANASHTRPIDLVRAPIALAQAVADERDVTIRAELDPDLPRVRGDRARLEEALTHLLRVAGTRSAARATITLSADAAPDVVGLTIAPAPSSRAGIDVLLARRLLETVGATLDDAPDAWRVSLPR